MSQKPLKDIDVNHFEGLDLGSSNVTVLVTTFNHVRFVTTCLDSILAQETDFDFRLVIFDDNSSDGTRDILMKYKSKYPGQITLMLAPENQFSLGRDTTVVALRKIKSEYIAFCEGDDAWFGKNKLQKQFEFMERNKSWCSISHHDVDVMDSTGTNLVTYRLHREHWVRTKRTSGRNLVNGNFIYTCTVMVRRDALRDDFLSRINGRQPGDYLLYSLACESGDIGFLKNVVAGYRIHNSNMWAGKEEYSKNQLTRQAQEFLSQNLLPPLSLDFLKFLRNGIRAKDDLYVRVLRALRFSLYLLSSKLQRK